MTWLQAVREVLRYEWLLLRRHRKLAAAAVGLLFVPALYALIYLWSMWDPTSHTNELPVGLVIPGQRNLPTATLLARLAEAGLSLREFGGTEERTGW